MPVKSPKIPLPELGENIPRKPLEVAAPDTVEIDEEDWVCPHTEVGETVWYWPDGNTQGIPSIAVVTSVNSSGDFNITATRITRNNAYLAPIEYTILHTDDPRLVKTPMLRRHGVWDLRPATKRLLEMERRLDALEAK